jgi:hypothetical protein
MFIVNFYSNKLLARLECMFILIMETIYFILVSLGKGIEKGTVKVWVDALLIYIPTPCI